MTTPSSATKRTVGDMQPLPDASTGVGVPARPKSILDFFVQEWRWLVLGLIYLLGWYTPFTNHGTSGDGPLAWSWSTCCNISLTLGFELWVPVLAGIVIWSRRAELKEQWGQIVANYPPGHKKRQGNLVPLAIGCFLLFVSHIIEVKGIGVGALVLIVWGIVYRVYGPLMVRALIAPLSMLILMIPPPDHIAEDLATYKVVAVCAKLAAQLLSVAGVHTTTLPNGASVMMFLHGYAVEINPFTCAGTNVAISVTLILLTYHLCRRTDPTLIVLSFIIGIVLSFALQILRIAAIGLLTGPSPVLASWLMQAWLVSALQIAFTTWVTLSIIKISFLDRVKMPTAVRQAARTTNRNADALAGSLDRSVNVFTYVGNLWNRSERATERMLKKLTPKSKKRRRW